MKVILLYDVIGWAYYHEAIGMQSALIKHSIECDIEAYPKFYNSDSQKKRNQYDIVFLMPRQANPLTYPATKTIVKFSSFGDFSKQKEMNTENFARFVCTNKQIYSQAIMQLPHLKDKIRFIPLAVSTSNFKPLNKTYDGKLIVGFAGNHKRSSKGYDLIKDSVSKCGTSIIYKEALAGPNRLNYKQMNQFYNSVHVMICMSAAEGGPLTGFESGACGTPMICGCKKSAMDDIIIDRINGFNVDRTVDSLTDKIKFLSNNKNIVENASSNILHTITTKHSWDIVIPKYISLFKEII